MATALTSLLTRFTDKCNRVLAGGIVKTYEPNSLTPKVSYQNPEGTIPNLPEVVLDETGRAKIYLLGDYRVQVYSNDGVLIEDNLLVEQALVQRDFDNLSTDIQQQVDNVTEQFQTESAAVIQEFQNNSNNTLDEFQTEANDAISKVQSTGGLISVPTLTALQAITSAYANQSAIVESTGAYYRWNATATPPAWVPTGRNFLTEAATYTDNELNAYRDGTHNRDFSYLFSIDNQIVSSGNIQTSSSYKRTDFIKLSAGDVVNIVAYRPVGAVFSSVYVYDSTKAFTTVVDGGTSNYSTIRYVATEDCFVLATYNKSNASFPNATCIVTTKEKFLNKTNLDITGALSYPKFVKNIGGTDNLDVLLVSETDLTLGGNVFTFGTNFAGSVDLEINNGVSVTNRSDIYLKTIPVKAGTRIVGKVRRAISVSPLVLLDANKKPVSTIVDSSTANPSTQNIDVTVAQDGYVYIQAATGTIDAATSVCQLRFYSANVIMTNDKKDQVGGFLSFDKYQLDNVQRSKVSILADLQGALYGPTSYINSSGVYTAVAGGGSRVSGYLTCLPNLTLELKNLSGASTGITSSILSFYDSNKTFISSVVLPSGQSIFYRKLVTPVNTAFMRFSNSMNSVALTPEISLILDGAGSYYYANFIAKLANENRINVRGDSISQGITARLEVADNLDNMSIMSYGVGGENVMDISLRAGTVNIVLDSRGVTVPADGSAVTLPAFFNINRSITYNADGTYTTAGLRQSSWGPGGTNIPFEFDGQKFFVNMSSATTSTIRFQSAQASAYTFKVDTSFNTKIGRHNGTLFIMMGTNGGFGDAGTEAGMNTLLDVHKRIADAYLGKCIIAGYYYAPLATKAYYKQIMEKQFGARFIDWETYFLTQGYTEAGITFNATEIAFIAQYQGVTKGTGNSALPIFSGDNTHPTSMISAVCTNVMLKRAYDLGFLNKLIQVPLNIPTDADIITTTAPAASIAVGATTTIKVDLPTTTGYMFEWTSSNPAVASVPTRNWLTQYGTGSQVTVTGVSAGTAIITCTCRYGGATKTFGITVT